MVVVRKLKEDYLQLDISGVREQLESGFFNEHNSGE